MHRPLALPRAAAPGASSSNSCISDCNDSGDGGAVAVRPLGIRCLAADRCLWAVGCTATTQRRIAPVGAALHQVAADPSQCCTTGASHYCTRCGGSKASDSCFGAHSS